MTEGIVSLYLVNIISALYFSLSALKGREKSEGPNHPAKTWQKNFSEQKFSTYIALLEVSAQWGPTGCSWYITTWYYVKLRKLGHLEATGKDQCRPRSHLSSLLSSIWYFLWLMGPGIRRQTLYLPLTWLDPTLPLPRYQNWNIWRAEGRTGAA